MSFGYFLPSSVISSFKHRCLNVHPSLLPKYRGAAPIDYAILNGDEQTGVSIIDLDEREWDAGRILKQEALVRICFVGMVGNFNLFTSQKISPGTTYERLHHDLAECGAVSLLSVLRDLDHFKLHATHQDSSQASLAPKISKEMSMIDFQAMAANEVLRRHRAIGHRYPLFCMVNGKRLLLLDMRIAIDDPEVEAGAVVRERSGRVLVGCADGKGLELVTVRLEGRRACAAGDYLNGRRLVGRL